MKKHNFSAGPSILPKYTIEQTANAILDLDGTGLSLMEISHRSKEFISIMTEAQNLLKELLDVPEGYSVLYLGGGASLQFLMVPMNFLKNKAAYLNTGSWSSKAIKEAKSIGEVIEVASSKDKNFSYIPKNYTVPADVDYFHITTNNTIFGTQLKTDPNVPVLMAADMSSDILSRPVDVSKYSIIYGGLQKNIGPSGCAFVIVKDDLLGLSGRKVPTYLDYKIHVENESMFNTPPVVPVYSALMTYRWLKELGGVKAIQKINEDKAALLYNEIDSNRLFKSTVEDASDRSVMNVCFVMADDYKDLEEEFMTFAKERGMVGIKGHRSVGGFRASIYNAMPTESVKALIDCMKEFDRKK